MLTLDLSREQLATLEAIRAAHLARLRATTPPHPFRLPRREARVRRWHGPDGPPERTIDDRNPFPFLPAWSDY